MKAKYRVFGVSLLVLLGLDQATKIWVMNNLEYRRDTIDIIDGWLLLEHARNNGAAFSMLEGQMALLIGFVAVALCVIGYMMWQLEDDDRIQAIALGVIASGAMGNGIDRVIHGSVTDFVRFYAEKPPVSDWLIALTGSPAWPTFNVADMSILAGVGLSLLGFALADKEDDGLIPDPAAVLLDDIPGS